mmetsp:Transcript_28026/g.42386  ORF Transcript_28026/g.42386 Transcript_28026/m.42386 type:complete len:119 (+) Transcript_28026:1506-1862(+)
MIDFKAQKVVDTITVVEGDEGIYIQSMTMVNNCLGLLVGLSSGDIKMINLQTNEMIACIERAHLEKFDESVNCILSLEGTEDASGDDKLPFFVTGGADSLVKVYEHNPYAIKEDEKKE